MSTFASTLAGIARNKLHLAVGGNVKDNCSLHRWVLLKNSITKSQPSTPASSPTSPSPPPQSRPSSSSSSSCSSCSDSHVQYLYRDPSPTSACSSSSQQDLQVTNPTENDPDTFVFPDPDVLLELFCSTPPKDVDQLEAQWFDSLLEQLEEDDSDDDEGSRDEFREKFFPSPSLSPLSSSEDLTNTVDPPLSSSSSSQSSLSSSYYHTVPYPIPYPPLFHPPLILPDHLDYHLHDLPYFDVDDIDDLSVPEAVEDTSDDESDLVTTPCIRSTSSFIADPASIPLPPETLSHVYINSDDDTPSLYHFTHLSSNYHHRPSVYHQEC